jgi:hypothetical protein
MYTSGQLEKMFLISVVSTDTSGAVSGESNGCYGQWEGGIFAVAYFCNCSKVISLAN